MKRLRDLRGDAAAVSLLCLLVIVATWRTTLAGRVLAGGDIFTYFYPYWAEATRAIRSARLPLWNPSLFMGVPFLANSQVGFFYPLNWPLWLLLPAHRSVHVTITLHLCLAALNAYVWGRSSLRLGRVGGWTVGAVFALGGYLGAQGEHVNQLQGLAWLPLMLMLAHRIVRLAAAWAASEADPGREAGRSRVRRSGLRASCALALVTALVLLAGHTQTAFISLLGTALYGLVVPLWRALRGGDWRLAAGGAVLVGVGVLLGVALAAVQLLPTWQLSQLSVRAGGLPFNERVSFSLSPLYVGRALLPPLGGGIPPEHIEHVAYVGITGLVLASAGFLMDVCRRREREPGAEDVPQGLYALVFLGLAFALGLYNPFYVLLARYVPGFAHFRVPARWVVLYVIGVAALAGRGVQALWARRAPVRGLVLPVTSLLVVLIAWAAAGVWLAGGCDVDPVGLVGWAGAVVGSVGLLLVARRLPRAATVGLLLLLAGELLMAGRALPQNRATAPQAFTSLRPAVAHLLASESPEAAPRSRFLSMSDTTFDPGDLSLIERIYGPQLSDEQLYDYIVATKQKEILSPNLPLAFDVPAVDGYGGGLLPLQRYVSLQRAFLPEHEVSIDGRLRENLTRIPAGRWLSLFNVRYVITDKLRDAWIDDVFYDLEFGARLSQGQIAAVGEVPDFAATSLGLVSHLEQGVTLPDGSPVGMVRVGFEDGSMRAFEVRAGAHVHQAPLHGQGDRIVTRLRWREPRRPLTVTVEATLPDGSWAVRGLSLIDERTGSFQSLVLSDRGRFRLVHSGDVKIYENLKVLPRAFIVPRAQVVDDDEAALRVLQDPTFDLSSQVVLSGAPLSCTSSREGPATATPAGSVTIAAYEPERVVVEATVDRPGYLVLTDAHYPGWQATVDGESAPIYRADLLFRAVALEPGQHRVVFTFQSALRRVGASISLGVLIVLAVVWHERRIVGTWGRCYNRMRG
jgi:hypothetical protein